MLRGLRQNAACGGKPGADAGLDDAALGEPAVASRNSVEPRVASRGDAVASRGRAFVRARAMVFACCGLQGRLRVVAPVAIQCVAGSNHQ